MVRVRRHVEDPGDRFTRLASRNDLAEPGRGISDGLFGIVVELDDVLVLVEHMLAQWTQIADFACTRSARTVDIVELDGSFRRALNSLTSLTTNRS